MGADNKKTGILPEDGASEEIVKMTREEALDYLGLPADADKEAVENRFWQLSKKYRTMRGDESEQKMSDLSAAYDIATGNRDIREEAAKARANEKQFLGKTKSEWKAGGCRRSMEAVCRRDTEVLHTGIRRRLR